MSLQTYPVVSGLTYTVVKTPEYERRSFWGTRPVDVILRLRARSLALVFFLPLFPRVGERRDSRMRKATGIVRSQTGTRQCPTLAE